MHTAIPNNNTQHKNEKTKNGSKKSFSVFCFLHSSQIFWLFFFHPLHFIFIRQFKYLFGVCKKSCVSIVCCRDMCLHTRACACACVCACSLILCTWIVTQFFLENKDRRKKILCSCTGFAFILVMPKCWDVIFLNAFGFFLLSWSFVKVCLVSGAARRNFYLFPFPFQYQATINTAMSRKVF